jgi:predicted aldo/keto reductase-like oxidoreductase
MRQRLDTLDYSAAEQVCPHHLPIAALMKEATRLLA